ncbi:MAG: GNAT family N-acetyltransferase [Alphaproteobacteria bacterium]
MASFTIRRASAADAEAIGECHREAIRKRAAGFYSEEIIADWARIPDEIERSRRRGEIANRDWIYLVAEADGEIIGFGIVIPSANELRALYSRPNPHGGVGSSILAALFDLCRQQGCAWLEMSSSLNAEKFYLDHGFRALSKSHHVSNSGVHYDCVKMRIDL